MSRETLETLRRALEGGVPSLIATAASDGTPNLTYVSQVEYVDRSHVALSFQFFNKTRENILANPQATALVTDPDSARQWLLHLIYLRTESAGALFERMKAKLAGIASQTGMAGVFQLRGSDVYRVAAIEALPGPALSPPADPAPPWPGLRRCLDRLLRCQDLESLFDEALAGLDREFGLPHSLLWVADPARARLYAVASRGYASSGIGAEVGWGEGVIGVAAREGTAIRLAHLSSEYAYGRAVREAGREAGLPTGTEIPFPGLAEPQSQIAVPLQDRGLCRGVLYLDSPQPRRFGAEEEDVLSLYAAVLVSRISLLQGEEGELLAEAASAPPAAEGPPLRVRLFEEGEALFVDDQYLIKGVAAAVLWKLLQDHQRGRAEFTTRELRVDPTLRLPEIVDNLDTRLILLRRRLAERCPCIALERSGRGRFRLRVERPLQLERVTRNGG